MKTIWSIGRPKKPEPDQDLQLDLAGEDVPVRVRRNARAKRMILRVCAQTGDIRLTLPNHVGLAAAGTFARKHTGWLLAERSKLTPFPGVTSGDSVLYRGAPVPVLFTGKSPRKILVQDDGLHVGGPVDLAPARLAAWLKAEARARLSARAQHYATQMVVSYARLSIGDTRSRWGSCSSSRTLRFNWRLIMAPDAVLDYVAAHEVAHLHEMNHSPHFWAHVAGVMPDFQKHRKWLKTHGAALQQVRIL